jgi:hypothetical protein
VSLNVSPIFFRVRLEKLVIKANIPAGMNPFVLMGMVPLLKETTEDHKPILISHLGKDMFQIQDGRHRYVASIIAGRTDILCKLDSNEDLDV